MRKNRTYLALACLVGALWFPGKTLFSGVKQDFARDLADLQASPDDLHLRRQVIEMGLKLKALPATPDEVGVLEGQAVFLAKSATEESDYQPAAETYMKASNLAPWDSTLYYNAGVLFEKAGQPGTAITTFKLYLLAKPGADDRAAVLDRIGKLEVLRDRKSAADAKARQDAQDKQRADAQYQGAMRAWQARETPALWCMIPGVIVATGGFTWVLLDYLAAGTAPGGNYYTQAAGPNEYQGESGYTLYNGNYYTNSNYASFIQTRQSLQNQLPLAWGTLGVGVVLTAVGIIISPGPHPVEQEDALFNLKGGQVAWGVPPMGFDSRLGVLKTTLAHVEF